MNISASDPYAGIPSVAVIGNYLPRQCGIATFTTDLVESLSTGTDSARCRVIAMNDKPGGYPYPRVVRFEINQNNLADYQAAAEYITLNQADVVCLQHEYGIYGGPAGNHILRLLSELHTPVVTTLHTVLAEPDKDHKAVMMHLARFSSKLVVMSQRAVDILNAVYKIPEEKIAYIPHGIPDMPFGDSGPYKDQLGLSGKKILLTSGLLSRNKGIEYVLEGLPRAIRRFPELVYIVLGATHPHVLQSRGEQYRSGLQELVDRKNMTGHVIFQNRFVTQEEFCRYLAAADVFITPYISEAQITSGTLAYAMGTGKTVISTPYWHAKEMLSDGRGILVPFQNAEAIAGAIITVLEDEAGQRLMRRRAYDFSRTAIWKEVARRYLELFREIRQEHNGSFHLHSFSNHTNHRVYMDDELPPLKLDHLFALTDDTGILQHATYTVANRSHGYCTDDNARALIFAMRARRFMRTNPAKLDALCNCYLSFLCHAFDAESGRFRNFMNYSRQWLERAGSEDSHGRALWSLGTAAHSMEHTPSSSVASTLFKEALRTSETFRSPRAVAFTLLGIRAYLKTFSEDAETRHIFTRLADRLFGQFQICTDNDWPWPENVLAYANARLPHALLAAGQELRRDDMIKKGLHSLSWLLDEQTEKDHLSPVGNHGWYVRGKKKARFDQQPIEANALLEACIAAFHISHNNRWLEKAAMCFNWFLGRNDLNLPLYDAKSGGCRDGLQSDGINQNEGAESTLAWLMSLTAMHNLSAGNITKPATIRKPARALIQD